MADDSKLHIGLFPWLAFGHMIPYLEFAKAIAKKGHTITFISTPRNIDRLPKLPPEISPLISFVKLPLPSVDGLPEDAEATTDLPYDKVQYLKKAFDSLKQPLTTFLQTCDIDWLFYDFAPYWLPDVASGIGISHGFFSIFLAAVPCIIAKPPWLLKDDRSEPEEFTVPPKWVTFPSKVAFKLFEITKIFESVVGDASDVSDLFRFSEVLKGSEIIAVRSSLEFEPEWLNLLEEIFGKPCITVGMLPTTEHDGDESETWIEIKQWLDRQEKKSVVYVAFGSEAKPNQIELTEIAAGLELSGLPFFWVLRKRRGIYDTEVIELPEGFEERTKGRGIVWNTWAPQLKILSHDSVGGFLTHSGWSSVVEASIYERPLILLTFLADQGINARLLEEKKMGYPIPRNEKDGYFSGENVAESLKMVVVEEEGQIYRDKAKEMKLLFTEQTRQDMYVDQFVHHLQRNRRTKNKLLA
ncbi:UDP-glycosyltransferase 91A1-like [Euphorbia lathyris]|uniref:UDP-glycosyltransferase 91A1-like n=1 Tax=Euphorbia lathyris TaxID=212925 RepID=UPI003313A13E